MLELFISNLSGANLPVEVAEQAMRFTAPPSSDERKFGLSDRVSKLMSINSELVNLADQWIRGLDPSRVELEQRPTYRKYNVRIEGAVPQTLCSLTVTGKGSIHLLTKERDPTSMAAREMAEGIEGVAFRDMSKVGHWGVGNFDMTISEKPWVEKGELPERVKEIITDAYHRALESASVQRTSKADG